MQFLVIPFSIILLYLTRRKLTVELGKLIRRFGGGHRTFAIVWSLIFLPGTIIHEISHFFAAAITGTHTGRIEIFPTLPRGGIGQEEAPKNIHLGSVQTQELGLFRGFLVGAAPFLVGLGLLIWIAGQLQVTPLRQGFEGLASDKIQVTWPLLFKLYLFFNVANSLFLSWVDFRHALPLIIVGVLLGGILYAIGVQPIIAPNSVVLEIAARLQTALLWSVGINIVAAGLLWGVNSFLL